MAQDRERGEERDFTAQETPASENLGGEAPHTPPAPGGGAKGLNGQAFCLETTASGAQTESRPKARKPLVARRGQKEMRQRAEASAGPAACNLRPEGLPARSYPLAAMLTPQNLRFSLRMETRDTGISLVGQPGSGGHEGSPKSLGAPRAAFEAEIQSIFEDSCSVCGQVGKMFKNTIKARPSTQRGLTPCFSGLSVGYLCAGFLQKIVHFVKPLNIQIESIAQSLIVKSWVSRGFKYLA